MILKMTLFCALLILIPTGSITGAVTEEDPYGTYVKTSQDFKPVKQDKQWLLKAYPSWVFMPWYSQWPIGFDDASGEFSRASGFNGSFIDKGNSTYLEWINKHQLRFYMDHAAGKGDLHLWDAMPKEQLNAVHGTGMRIKPLNAAMLSRMKGVLKNYIGKVKSSPMRAAYALDDEISWGSFVHPCMWQVTDDQAAYANWLKEIYGAAAPKPAKWVSYNDVYPKLKTWDIATFDASTLMNQWSFNDSYWNNFLGELVEHSNSIDPATPCGHVGGQTPSAFGGYDYAKQMRKIQFIEAYNAGSSQAIIRSFNPRNAIASVTSYFHRSVDDGVWQAWYYLAQGNRGHIGWVRDWFDGKTPKEWIKAIAPTYLECGQKIGPLLSGAEWKHDGVAIYYSHASIQLGWILDAQAHGKTWVSRNDDDKLGASHLVRRAWLNMLRDEGIQANFISYVDVIQKGIPPEYKVLVLPATLCLSDAEARAISAFCEAGGTVIADYMPGLWDQHGKGRKDGGALDKLFGVVHSSKLKGKDLFNGGALWCEVDQNENFSYKSYDSLMSNKNTCIKDESGFNKAVRELPVKSIRKAEKGTAVLLNLSPQWYNAYRVSGMKEAAKRSVFMEPVHAAGIERAVRIKGAGEKEFGYEITAWKQGGRTILFVISNVEITVNQFGGGNSVGLKSETIPIELEFLKAARNVKDERSGKNLGDGSVFKLDWKMNEACVISYE